MKIELHVLIKQLYNFVVRNVIRKTIRKISDALLKLLICFALFLAFECVRTRIFAAATPIIVLDRTKYSLDCIAPGEEINISYDGLGYIVTIKYYLPYGKTGRSSIEITGKMFHLIPGIPVWAWTRSGQ